MKDFKLSALWTLAAAPVVVTGVLLDVPPFKQLFYVPVLSLMLLWRWYGDIPKALGEPAIIWLMLITFQCLIYFLLIWITVKILRALNIIGEPPEVQEPNDGDSSAT